MIRFDEALRLLGEAAAPLDAEILPVEAAEGRVLADPVIARISSPRADVSAMDGYAVRDADLGAGALKLVGEFCAGASWDGEVGPGECVRIFTGAAVPAGADRVVIQENVRREDASVFIEQLPGDARYVRKSGSDFRAGDLLLARGRLLDPKALVAAAGGDCGKVEVYRKPSVTILATGDELAAPGTAAEAAGAIPDSVSIGLAAMCRLWGGEVVGCARLPDELVEMNAAADAAVAASDLVVVTGGASVGERDFSKAMFEGAGLQPAFSKVAIRPGKPVWFGRTGEALVLGLPGNPTSAMVTARLFLAPLLAGLNGRAPESAIQWRTAILAAPLPACGARETFHRARWHDGAVALLGFQESHAQRALAEAELLVRQRPNSAPIAAGEQVEVLDF